MATRSEIAVDKFVERWQSASGSERANYQLFVHELCTLLELPTPDPAREDTRDNAYAFERRITFRHGEHLRPAHWRGFHEAVTAGKAKSKGHSVLSRAVHKSAKKLYVEPSFVILVDKAGKTLGALATARDVTERHLAGARQHKQ